jgi:hypothetical protein
VLGVARDLVVATLFVAGVTSAPVERREQGRSREEEGGLGLPTTCAIAVLAWADHVRESGRGRARAGGPRIRLGRARERGGVAGL